MPLYEFINDNTGERKQIIMGMNDSHEYIDETGYQWRRVFFAPQTAIDTKWDESNPKDFVEKTAKRKGSMNDLWQKSAELSSKREKRYGKDGVKEKYYQDYSKKRKGRLHKDLENKKLKEDLSKHGIKIEF